MITKETNEKKRKDWLIKQVTSKNFIQTDHID